MDTKHIYKLYKKFGLIDTDTRKIRRNTIFFALKGANFNGNKFALEALKLGASYAIVDEKEYAVSDNILLVNDVLKTLQELARYHRNQLNIPIISLTGSNGKTTTKELIKSVLSTQFNVTATKGNLNNHIGVPLTLLSMTEETEIGIVEMGANHHKEIAFLCSIARPNYGYITNFGKAHLEGFGSLEGVIEAKSELYDYLIASNKSVFVNPKDEIQMQKTINSKRILFEDAVKLLEVNPLIKLKINDAIIQSNLIGKYNYTNILAAITIGNYFQISFDNIKQGIENYIPSNNRSQFIKTERNHILLDAYNANPSSMKLAIENFKLIEAKEKTLFLGDMFELGTQAYKEHQIIADLVSQLNFKDIFLIGELFSKVKTTKYQFKNFEEVKGYIDNNPVNNQHILIKGSRGMALERLLDYL